MTSPTTSRSDSPPGALSTTRRRQLGGASARSTLLTVLGEFVHPSGESVWTATLIEALGGLGIEEKSARQALTRTANEGVLTSGRHGRRVLWSLTEQGTRLLGEGTERIYGFMRERGTWDGRWLVLSVPIPETQRQLRHRLRTRLTWLGMGSPTSGLWVSPDVGRAGEVQAVIDGLGLADLAFAWCGPAAAIGSETRLLAEAWDLDGVEARYLEFLDSFSGRAADDDVASYVATVQLVEAWRRFPFLDPDLPGALLDHDWPGPRAADCFHDRHAAWAVQARRAWETYAAAGGPQPT